MKKENTQPKKVWKFVVDKENFNGYAQSILIDGKSAYSPKTAEDYIAEGYSILTEKEFDKLMEEYEKSRCNDWKEITEEQYEYALNVLPPIKWFNGGFYIGECTSGSLYGFYQELNGKFYTSLQSIYTNRAEIVENLNRYIATQESEKDV